MTDHRKFSAYFPEEMIRELEDEAQRLDRSISWILQRGLAHEPRRVREDAVDGAEDAGVKFLRAWGPVIALAVVVLGGVWYMNRLRNQGNEAAQDRDRLALELAGANAAHEVTSLELRRTVTLLVTNNAGLQAEIDRVRGAMPGAGVVGTVSGSSGGVTVGPAAGIPVVGSPPASATGTVLPPVLLPCALYVGDRVELKVAGVALQGDSGAVAVAATAQAWRVGEPPVLLAEGPLRLEVKMKDPGELPGWAAGAVVVGGRGGWFLGPLLSPPPLRVWGLEASLLLGAGVGPGGEWGGLAGGLLRW